MKTEIKYGVIFAGIVVLYVLTEHFLGFNTTRHDIGQYTRYAGVLVPILGILFGIREKRKKELNGIMTFGQGVKTGFWIALIQTTITTLWFLLYANVINPGFLDTMLEFERSTMAAAGTTEASIIQQLDQKRTFFAFPTFQIFQEGLGIAYGVLFAAMFSFFLKRKPSTA
ncbi:MAG: DUF4199 domain-containing protein [Ignavibacteria bacterium]|nr:DUF4199 domain-containing protein [Ignavibacteria bacterium]